VLLDEVEEEAWRVVLASIIKIWIQKKEEERGQGELATHVELRTPHPAWNIGDCLLHVASAPGDWWRWRWWGLLLLLGRWQRWGLLLLMGDGGGGAWRCCEG
jgi:hypothetical protein